MGNQKILITGGAGFIGSNLTSRMLRQGFDVTVFDNLSRPGSEKNLSWLQETYGLGAFKLVRANVTDFDALLRANEGVDRVYHLAGQVAVTSSVTDPRTDFYDNALGTFNALEAARLNGNHPIFIYTSTNKVYGGMDNATIVEEAATYHYADLPYGVPETYPLDFHSPYGCSKGAGDQYTRDYARIYGLRTVVMRQSCIYGRRQFGVEDQGWVAWFIIAAMKGRPITIYGNGKQVRDILFVDDLLNAYDCAVENIETASGQIYNIGGGPENTLSIWAEFGPKLEKLVGHPIHTGYSEWRPGDQLIYVSDIRRAGREIGWRPTISVDEGIDQLAAWVRDNLGLFS